MNLEPSPSTLHVHRPSARRPRPSSRLPASRAVVVAVLALGIGANTAIFSIVYGVVLKPLPFKDPPAWWRCRRDDARRTGRHRVLRSEGLGGAVEDLRPDGGLRRKRVDADRRRRGGVGAESSAVSGDFFQMLGVPPLRGRWLTAADDGKGIARTAVISEALWKRHFASRRARHRPTRDVRRRAGDDRRRDAGAPSSFRSTPSRSQAWLPMHALGLTAQFADAARRVVHARDRRTCAPARRWRRRNAELATISARLAAQYPDADGKRVGLGDAAAADARPRLPPRPARPARRGRRRAADCVRQRRESPARARHDAGGARWRFAPRSARAAAASCGNCWRKPGSSRSPAAAPGCCWRCGANRRWCAASPIDIPRLRDVRLDGAVLAFVLAASVATALVVRPRAGAAGRARRRGRRR